MDRGHGEPLRKRPEDNLAPGPTIQSVGPDPGPDIEEVVMLSWVLTFLVLALVAAFFGFSGIAGASASIAKILFFVFLVLFVVSFFLGHRPRDPL